MNYLQIGALCVVGLAAIVIWWTCFVGLNKDVTYHNKRTRGPYALPRRKKRGKPLRGGTDSVLHSRQQPQLQKQTAKKTTAKRPPRGR